MLQGVEREEERSMNRWLIKGCLGKPAYASRAEAAAVYMKRGKGQQDMRIYHCACGGWHIGHIRVRQGRV